MMSSPPSTQPSEPLAAPDLHGSPRYRGPVLFAAVALLGFVVATLVDREFVVIAPEKSDYEDDWHRMFRVFGFLPLWLGVAVSYALIDVHRAATAAVRTWWGRAAALAATVTGGGLAAEIAKLLLRRYRPNPDLEGYAFDVDGYAFKPWDVDTLSSSKLGLPSSHAAVAFAAAWALCRLHPTAAPVWIVMAVGCAATRVMDGAHFVSDVYLGAVLSYAVSWQVWRWLGPAATAGASR